MYHWHIFALIVLLSNRRRRGAAVRTSGRRRRLVARVVAEDGFAIVGGVHAERPQAMRAHNGTIVMLETFIHSFKKQFLSHW